MCGIAGILHLKNEPLRDLEHSLSVMNSIQIHRGPDDQKVWIGRNKNLGFAHQRLSIIDLSTGSQPMIDVYGNAICYNGEVYNYIELKRELSFYNFKTNSDTEVILAAYKKWGKNCVKHFRGMFSFVIWDEQEQELFCARDRFGIKPLYYTIQKNIFYFASEVKTLLPFIEEINVNKAALKDYLYFQLYLGDYTLIEEIHELKPAHTMAINGSGIKVEKYWEVYYNLNFEKSPKQFEERLHDLIYESVQLHTRSDVPIGSYISGGIDSSIIASVAAKTSLNRSPFLGFTGKFTHGELYDESFYARKLADRAGISLYEIDINSNDFINSIEKVIYHLDYPVAGPGSFPQYHVSRLASQHRKVVLGGQGGDEIFGGYTRYLIAYFEQCIKGAIDNTLQNGNFVVTYESIIPNLVSLQNYKPLLKEFFKDGLFDPIDQRYFRLLNRAQDLQNEIKWSDLGGYSPFESFAKIFNGNNVGKESYFDKMTHFDFKALLPALLHVEDRMSMAHGLESRVPFLDHPLVEFAATMPADIKFKDGTLKMILTNTMRAELPNEILERRDKMGFPVPFNDWLGSELKEFIGDIFNSDKAKTRGYFNSEEILRGLKYEGKFGRKVWGLLSLELWYRQFYDQHQKFKRMLNKKV
jgi:asparagine synthase (glutamine-hydrolysing)